MKNNKLVHRVLKRYQLVGAAISKQLEETHLSFQVKTNNKAFVLRQYNQYMHAEDLRVQFLFAKLLIEVGLKSLLPIPTVEGDPFAQVNKRLWSLFPWYEGRRGTENLQTNLEVLTSTQGMWIQCGEKLRSNENWSAITATAQQYRQRKSWAWVVPLDQIPQFVESHNIISRIHDRVKRSNYKREYVNRLIALLPEAESSIYAFGELIGEKGINDLPHIVTNDDFTLGNIHINDADSVVLDLDCFSYEPRISDFARTLNHYYRKLSESDHVHLLGQFQVNEQLGREEIETLLLMMCAYDLYYAIMHILLFLEEEGNPEGQQQMINAIENEIRSSDLYSSWLVK